MIKIKEFDNRYNNEVNDFIISIFVDEYDFVKYREVLSSVNNINYEKSGGRMWLATNEYDEVIGTIALMKKDEDNAELKSFYVSKEYRGNGISKELFKKVMNYSKELGLKRIFLGTYERMETAIHFYKRRGFSEIEFEHEDEDARFFEKYI